MHRKASTTNTSEDNNKNKQHHHQHHHHQHHHPVQHNDTSNTNDTLREGKLVRLELLSGGLGVDNEDIDDIDNQLEEAAVPLLQQKKKLVGKTDQKTISNLAGFRDKDLDKDVALIDCVAHAQANVTIRESCDCVYQQQHQPHHSHGSHLHQNPRYNIDPDQVVPAVEMGGDIGFRRVANNCAKLAATSKHTVAAAATSKAADATVIATKDAAVKAAASKAAAIAAIKAAASTTTGLIDDSTAKVDWL